MIQILVELSELSELALRTEEIRKAWESGEYRKLLFHVYSGCEGKMFTT